MAIPGVGNESRLFQALFAGGQQGLDEEERRRQSALSVVRTLAPVGIDTIGLGVDSLNQFLDRDQRASESSLERGSREGIAHRRLEGLIGEGALNRGSTETIAGNRLEGLIGEGALDRRSRELIDKNRLLDNVADRGFDQDQARTLAEAILLRDDLDRKAQLAESTARESGLAARSKSSLAQDKAQFDRKDELARFTSEIDRDPLEIRREGLEKSFETMALDAGFDEGGLDGGPSSFEAGESILELLIQRQVEQAQRNIEPQTLERFQPGGGFPERLSTRRLRADQFESSDFPDSSQLPEFPIEPEPQGIPPEFLTPFGQDRRKGVLENISGATVDPVGRAIMELLGIGGQGSSQPGAAAPAEPSGPRQPLFPISPEMRERLRRQIKGSSFPGVR